jgi:signal transduction histidine kinase
MGVAPEIRNPMVTIGGFAARIARDSRNSEDTRRFAVSILEDARKLEEVVNKIQQYCNLPEASTRKEDISEAIEQTISQTVNAAERKKVRVRFRNQLPQPCHVVFDAALFKIAITNLLENAIDYSADGGTIDILVHRNEEGIVIQVGDSGPGINDKDRGFIFDPFFSTRIHRSGMGLALVERIIREHMGRIEVDSAPGRGTTMRVILPQEKDE